MNQISHHYPPFSSRANSKGEKGNTNTARRRILAVVAIGRRVGDTLHAITATRAVGAAVSADEAVAVEAGAGARYARQVGGGQGRSARGEGLAIDGEEELLGCFEY